MTLPTFHEVLRRSPLIASVQASDNSPLNEPQLLLALARCSLWDGVEVLRLNGVDTIRTVETATAARTIGLIKKRYSGSEIYITPTTREVRQLLDTRCEVIALDGTLRARPGDEPLEELIELIHDAGRLALADCDTVASALAAEQAGADMVSTTLRGYTSDTSTTPRPDLDFLAQLVASCSVPVLAEGNYREAWQVRAALRIGAVGVVMGAALNDPLRNTQYFLQAALGYGQPVGAIDIGGTNMRFAVFDRHLRRTQEARIPTPSNPTQRLQWIRDQVAATGVRRVGISTGGTVDPVTGAVIESKELIPANMRTIFDRIVTGAPTIALNDGLASAWAHACHPRYAGARVATLAIGTGLGAGFVDGHQLVVGRNGRYPRFNDLVLDGTSSLEYLVCGGKDKTDWTQARREQALAATAIAIQMMDAAYCPEFVVICGGVGASDWMKASIEFLRTGREVPRVEVSPFGADAGLVGAACLALWPPVECADLARPPDRSPPIGHEPPHDPGGAPSPIRPGPHTSSGEAREVPPHAGEETN